MYAKAKYDRAVNFGRITLAIVGNAFENAPIESVFRRSTGVFAGDM